MHVRFAAFFTSNFLSPGVDQTSAACRALSREIVEWSTLKLNAISRSGSPAATRLSASHAWWGVSLRGRPNSTPLAPPPSQLRLQRSPAGSRFATVRRLVKRHPDGDW